MNQRIRYTIFYWALVIAIWCFPVRAWSQETTKREALLIHHDVPLYPDSSNNVSVFAKTLSYLNFSVVVLANPKAKELTEALHKFVNQSSDLNLLYYSGPGYGENGINYLYGNDSWISAQSLFRTKPQGHRLILLDDQRMIREEGHSGWDKPSELSTDVLLSLGTAPTMINKQIPSYISPFVEELSIFFPRMGHSVQDAFKKVHRHVKKKTKNGQIPALRAFDSGKFRRNN